MVAQRWLSMARCCPIRPSVGRFALSEEGENYGSYSSRASRMSVLCDNSLYTTRARCLDRWFLRSTPRHTTVVVSGTGQSTSRVWVQYSSVMPRP